MIIWGESMRKQNPIAATLALAACLATTNCAHQEVKDENNNTSQACITSVMPFKEGFVISYNTNAYDPVVDKHVYTYTARGTDPDDFGIANDALVSHRLLQLHLKLKPGTNRGAQITGLDFLIDNQGNYVTCTPDAEPSEPPSNPDNR